MAARFHLNTMEIHRDVPTPTNSETYRRCEALIEKHAHRASLRRAGGNRVLEQLGMSRDDVRMAAQRMRAAMREKEGS